MLIIDLAYSLSQSSLTLSGADEVTRQLGEMARKLANR